MGELCTVWGEGYSMPGRGVVNEDTAYLKVVGESSTSASN